MEDSDATDTTQETLTAQYSSVKTRTDKSAVMQWGDKSFVGDMVSEFLGDLNTNSGEELKKLPPGVSAREVDVKRLYDLYRSAATAGERIATGSALQDELARQQACEATYGRFPALVYPHDAAKQEAAITGKSSPNQPECELAVHQAIRERAHKINAFDANTGFALQFHQIVVNICDDVAAGGRSAIEAVVAAATVAVDGPKSLTLV